MIIRGKDTRKHRKEKNILSREVMEIVQRMDSRKIGNQLVLQCAPLIVGLKMSNLFIIQNEHISKMYRLLKESRISYYVFLVTEKMSTLFLYDREKLENFLSKKQTRLFFQEEGYLDFDLQKVLFRFRCQYRLYWSGKRDFPHELGLLLGYPIEDVNGFILNKGKKSLYTGYWKVYDDVQGKKELFRMYELAKETLIQLVFNGISIAEIIDTYNGATL